ncbi:glycosyltransferase [Roseovarius sp. LXJ103]|uniref:glycosyltransferase n=1 Tax=Roseovarius carneus TaxID=2853164 RepID=UPI000D614D71|nr:glycosyltransferase [Roseovarius carneus]MBZ8119291.1 glycosyltransferase [Roseovarius carneus]PWE35090.1 colanic acid biosynthesis glycosyltransferase WcaL [Pelagicola sp. LXJ1103]
MKIAYILNTYPQPSHSFIRRELHALETQEFEITRLAMRAANVDLVDPGDIAEAGRTEYVLRAGPVALLIALFRALLAGPARFAEALALAWRMGARSEVGRFRHLIYLVEAAYILRRCQVLGITHCHAHFGTNAAAVATLTHALGGPRYSFTVHGPEEFDAPRALGLAEKVSRAAFAVAISSYGRAQLCRLVDHAQWDKIKIVHCGIEVGKFNAPAPIPKTGLRLVAIGRFVEQKGQMVLVPALARLSAAHPELELVMIGDGSLRPVMEAALKAEGLSKHVRFTGWLDEAGVRAELASAHALIMPSFAEGLPMVVMEAMASARPVIATYIAGMPELVLPGETGWLVPAGDDAALAKAVETLAAMPHTKRMAMGKAARARVLERHDAHIEAAKLAAHIRAL